MRVFSLVHEPFKMESNSDLLSVSRRSGSFLEVRVESSLVIVIASSNISLKDMSPDAITERQMRLSLYDRKMSGMPLSESSPRKILYPSSDERSALLLKEAY